MSRRWRFQVARLDCSENTKTNKTAYIVTSHHVELLLASLRGFTCEGYFLVWHVVWLLQRLYFLILVTRGVGPNIFVHILEIPLQDFQIMRGYAQFFNNMQLSTRPRRRSMLFRVYIRVIAILLLL